MCNSVSHQTRHNILKKNREIVDWQQKVKGKFRDFTHLTDFSPEFFKIFIFKQPNKQIN
jgi:hypothetical protein